MSRARSRLLPVVAVIVFAVARATAPPAAATAPPAAPAPSPSAPPAAATAASTAPDAESVRAAVSRHLDGRRPAILRELADLLALPNVASNRGDIDRNAALLVEMMRRHGIEADLLTVPDAPPAVFAEVRTAGAERTVVFYAHYDGQPVDPAAWTGDPWRPLLRDRSLAGGGKEIPFPAADAARTAMNDEWRLYGRSASDDKAPIVAILAALDALRGAGLAPTVNLKFFLEGEEEAGSPNLERLLRAHRDRLAADLWLICDGPRHQSGRMQVYFGVRGVVDLELTLYGPGRPLHSGHYGNWAPNPIGMLAHLLAGMRDAEGNVAIPGFHDTVRPLDAAERRALDGVPDLRAALMDGIGIARTEGEGRSLEEAIMRPAMNLRGIRAGGVGAAASNAIPAEAQASIDFRLVPDQTPALVREQVERYLRGAGYEIVRDPPDGRARRAHPRLVRLEWGAGYPPSRTPLDLPASRAVARVLSEAAGGPIVELPTLGGSVPLFLFRQVLGAPSIGVPIVNHDNNQHAADENLRLGNLWEGIAFYAGLMARLGPAWAAADQSDETTR
jgi:acetylornithine deacetylase/succinyl-diaminopimelate desuccinylase-like protein